MIRNTILGGLRRALPALAAVGLLGACHGILDVDRPTLVTEGQVKNDPDLINAVAQGAIEPFRNEYAWIAHAGAGQTDEALLTHGWSPWNQYDDRNVTPDGGAYDGITYPFLQQARQNTAATIERLEGLLGDKASTSVAYARANAYTGYANLLAADHLCQVPTDKQLKTPDEVRQMAIGYFDDAIAVAHAVTGDDAAKATDVIALAQVGSARAYLGMGNWAKAAELGNAALATNPDFAAYVGYIKNPDFGQWTKYDVYARVTGVKAVGEFSLGYSKEMYDTVNDLRVPMKKEPRRMFDSRPAARYSYTPYLPSSFSGYAPGNSSPIAEDANIRFASALEARYIIAEASLNGAPDGWSLAEVRSFINERRAAGAGHVDDFTGSDDGLLDQLIYQRKMDFMLAGFRMPDLLRYQRFYGKDLWPKGQMEGFLGGDWDQQYGTTTCWPVGASERM